MDLRSALERMLSGDNQIRSEAESFYTSQLLLSPSSTLLSLFSYYPSSPVHLKVLILLITQQLFDPLSSKELWSKLQSADQNTIKSLLLHLLSNEVEAKPSDLLSELIGKLTSNIYSNNIQWPELSSFLQTSLQAQKPYSFDLLSFTFVHLYKNFDLSPRELRSYLALEPYTVQYKSLKLTNSVLSVYQKLKTLPFSSLVPQILQTVYKILNADEYLGGQALEVLREIIENRGFLFTEHFPIILDFQSSALKLNIQISVKFLVTDCLVSLYESVSDLSPDQSPLIIQEIFNLMIQSEQDPNFDQDIQVEIDYSIIGRKQINRLIETVGENYLLQPTLMLVHKGLTDPDWRAQYSSIATLGEIVPFIAEPSKISELIPIITSSCSSNIQKLRSAGYLLITDLSLNYIQEFQATYHKEIFPIILAGCHDANISVRIQALSAACGFIEGAGYKISSLYIQSIPYFTSLFHCQTSIIEPAVKVISAFGKSSKASFSPYYRDSVDELLKILQRSPGSYTLKARVIESITLCSGAVGKQLFVSKISEIISAICSIEILTDDESLTYILNAWENICDLLQEDFFEYLDYIVPFLLRFLASPNEGVNVNTSEVINKEHALQSLNKFIRVLKGKFKYIDDTLRVSLPLVNYTLNDSLRTTAAEILVALVEAKKNTTEINAFVHCQDLGKVFIDLLLNAINEEFNKDALVAQLESITGILNTVGSAFLLQEKVNELSKVVLGLLVKKSGKYSGNEDKWLIFALTDVIGAVFKTHSYMTAGVLNKLSAEVIPGMINSKEKVLQRAVLFIIDDAVEYLSQSHATGKWDEVISILLCFAADSDDETRQAAVYGLGAYSMACSDFSQRSSVILNALWSSLNVDSKRIKTKGLAKDNSISAISKIIKFQSSCIDVQSVLEKWIFLLPLKWDKDEAVFSHGVLAEMLDANATGVINGDRGRMVQVLKVVAEVWGTKLVDGKGLEGIRRFLVRNSQDVEGVCGDLESKVVEKLRGIISNNGN